ncbi:hypothetical protein TNCT_560261 [Trichonephila clavata]|uniref:Uncharacterized protein n=1 Tax=Trichonephila clavata TaxID=2740835 RepID=A0A8X6GGU2_TRICU|nr:hypothetical protein TNCT_560261 [Trichonephila clavata]
MSDQTDRPSSDVPPLATLGHSVPAGSCDLLSASSKHLALSAHAARCLQCLDDSFFSDPAQPFLLLCDFYISSSSEDHQFLDIILHS